MFISSLFNQLNLRGIQSAIARKIGDDAEEDSNDAGYIQLQDSWGNTQSKTKLFLEKSSTYLLPENTRYINITGGTRHDSWFKVTVISLFPIDGNKRNSQYRISATKFDSSCIDLTGYKTSGLIPLAIRIRQVNDD